MIQMFHPNTSLHINNEIEKSNTDYKIKALIISVNKMIKNIKQMVHNIENHFNNTNTTVLKMKDVSKVASEHSTAISGSTEDISKGAVGAAEAMQHTAEAVEQATTLAQEVQDKAEQSTKKS